MLLFLLFQVKHSCEVKNKKTILETLEKVYIHNEKEGKPQLSRLLYNSLLFFIYLKLVLCNNLSKLIYFYFYISENVA